MRFTEAARAEISGLLKQHTGKALRVRLQGFG